MSVGQKQEKRRRPRHKITKAVRAYSGGVEVDGETLDISGAGAALDIDVDDIDLEDDELLELDIEDVGALSGQVARSFDDGIGVQFMDIDEEEEEELVGELSRLDELLRSEDE